MRHINRTPAAFNDSIKNEDIEHIILFDSFSDWNMNRSVEYVHVLPETLCRYIGIEDKNGKKIFTGDIVRCYTGRICKVVFASYKSFIGYDLIPIGEFDCDPPNSGFLFYDIEVIGNVYDKYIKGNEVHEMD